MHSAPSAQPGLVAQRGQQRDAQHRTTDWPPRHTSHSLNLHSSFRSCNTYQHHFTPAFMVPLAWCSAMHGHAISIFFFCYVFRRGKMSSALQIWLYIGQLSATPQRWECLHAAAAALSTAWLLATKSVIVGYVKMEVIGRADGSWYASTGWREPMCDGVYGRVE